MSGIIKGKDIQSGSINFTKTNGGFVFGNLSEVGDGISLSFDGISGHIYHRDDTFLYIEFNSEQELTNVDLDLVAFGSTTTSVQSLHGRTLNSTTPVTFNALTIGAQRIVQVHIKVNETYYLVTGSGNAAASDLNPGTAKDLVRCYGFVQKFNG